MLKRIISVMLAVLVLFSVSAAALADNGEAEVNPLREQCEGVLQKLREEYGIELTLTKMPDRDTLLSEEELAEYERDLRKVIEEYIKILPTITAQSKRAVSQHIAQINSMKDDEIIHVHNAGEPWREMTIREYKKSEFFKYYLDKYAEYFNRPAVK